MSGVKNYLNNFVYDLSPNKAVNLLNSTSRYKSVVLLNVPKIGLNNPPMGPALIQSISKQMGSNVNFVDINLEFQKYFKDNKILNNWCELNLKISDSDIALVESFTNTLDLESIFSADIVGISVFSSHSVNYTSWFLKKYRKQIKGIVVVGGAGVLHNNYGKTLFDQGLVDYYIIGEGELAWRAILSNSLPYPGVNSSAEPLINFDSVLVPDYTNFKLDEYLNSKVYGTTIGVEGSRGCVRNCTFCDIRNFWQKYKFKDGIQLANELIELKETYNIKHFFFNDSLVNGSDKAFRDFIEHLAKYNSLAEDKIHWSGYYIIKPANTYKDKDWINLKNSGVRSLYIGIESGSETVRNHMKKKFSNTDIDHAMAQIQLHGIRCTWLMIIGYPTETEKDFQDTLMLLKKYQPMALDNTIDTVALGFTMGIIEGSPLELLKEELNIQATFPGRSDTGIFWKNDNSDFKIRVLRRIEAEKLVRELGYNSWIGDNDTVTFFEKKLDEIENGIILNEDIAGHHG